MISTAASPDLVTGGLDYFDYQIHLAREVVLPWLERHVQLEGARVGDFGCHEGGMLEGMRRAGVGSATGFELSEEVVRASRFVPDERFRIEVADLTELSHDETFDVVILHDVLEHVIDCRPVLLAARKSLGPSGRVFVSFPPYWSAFGGHQHLAAGWSRIVPYLHFLPARTFFRLAAPTDNEYMSREGSIEDLESVRKTRLSLARAEHEFAAASLRPVASEFFLLRPEYTVRYGIRSKNAGAAGRVPGLRELLVNGAFYLLAAAD